MKISKLLAGIMTAAVVLVGCSKKADTPPPRVGGVDVVKLRDAFHGSPEEVQRAVDQVLIKLRYHQYPEAVAGLDELTSNPAVTDPQKSALTNTIEQVK